MPRTGKALTLKPDQITALGVDWQAGMGSRALAVKYGITRNTVYAYLAMAGVRQVNNRIQLPKAKVTQLLKRHSRAVVTKRLGVSYKVLRDHIIRWGLTTTVKPPPAPSPADVADHSRCATCRVALQPGGYQLIMRRGDVVRVCVGCCK